MWPRTSWSLSSLTLNMVLGRASVTSPSISIFSSFPMRRERVAAPSCVNGGSAALERRLAGPLGEERAHRVLEVLGAEEGPARLGGDAVGGVHPTLAVGAHDPLRRR